MNADVRKTWALLRPHALPRLPILGAVLLLGSISMWLQNGILLLFEPLFNQVLFPQMKDAGGERGSIEGFVVALRESLGGEAGGDDGRLAVLWVVVGVVILSALLAAASMYTFTLLSRWVSLRMIVDLRLRLAEHLMGLSLRYHGQRRLGDLLSRISADVQKTLTMVQTVLKDFCLPVAATLGALGVATYASWKMAALMFLCLPILALPISLLSKRIRKGSTKSRVNLGASLQVLTQMFSGIRTVKAFRAEERELENYRAVNERYVTSSMRMVRAIALSHGATILIGIGGMGLLLGAVGWLAIRTGLFAQPDKLLIFFLATSQVYTNVKKLTKAMATLQESVGAGARLMELLEEPVDVREAGDPLPLERFQEEIAFEGVTFTYPGADRPALEGIDLTIKTGETLALVGASGSGKSTLVDLICRFVDPTSGSLTVDGQPLGKIALDDWCRQYALVDQVPFLFHASIEENIRYGKLTAERAEVEAAAESAEIHEFIQSLPEGYATDVEEAGTRLSGGQRQRMVIARAVLRGAPLLILDEATSALDSATEASVQRALDGLMAGRTVVVVAHRLSTIRNADRIAVLDEGRLVELGTHEELLEKGGTYARLHALQHGAQPVAQADG